MIISFEGIDGSGKSTQAQRLNEVLRKQSHKTLLVREPGGTPLSENIRSLLLDADGVINPRAELLLFSAARAQLVDDVIGPAMAEGTIVICDRYYDSTTAYQGAGRDVASVEWLKAFNLWVTAGLQPRRTYYIDVTPEEGYQRRNKRPTDYDKQDRMERADESFFVRVREAYLSLAQTEPDRIKVVNGMAPVDVIEKEIWKDLQGILKQE